MPSTENALSDCSRVWEHQIRRAPFAWVSVAALVGFFIRPVTLVRLVAAAIRPAVAIFVITKIVGLLRKPS